MREVARITEQLQRAFDGDAWSGPSLQATLAGLTAAQAAARPLAQAHSIGELVCHLTTWTLTVAQRLEQRTLTPLAAPDWPPFPATPDEAAWQQARQELVRAHQRLLAAVQRLPDADLDIVPDSGRYPATGSSDSWYVLLHGTAQHYLYHAGQVALLRKSF
ncbi:DinB family protein [Hymenobacter sp. 5516J-16]|uniref:DinB family protein n=1 Tax=Hymenobacter sp. 5516J-16 TaxID=2932253 RepID=UPI001FD3D750|nr:DinB family protein [Hymenobacter sp. 5516J-16]UOQ78457.1 DinB family protein [Hymenobacter sp. 5516J-16]